MLAPAPSIWLRCRATVRAMRPSFATLPDPIILHTDGCARVWLGGTVRSFPSLVEVMEHWHLHVRDLEEAPPMRVYRLSAEARPERRSGVPMPTFVFVDDEGAAIADYAGERITKFGDLGMLLTWHGLERSDLIDLERAEQSC